MLETLSPYLPLASSAMIVVGAVALVFLALSNRALSDVVACQKAVNKVLSSDNTTICEDLRETVKKASLDRHNRVIQINDIAVKLRDANRRITISKSDLKTFIVMAQPSKNSNTKKAEDLHKKLTRMWAATNRG
jgi:hypothetical protein